MMAPRSHLAFQDVQKVVLRDPPSHARLFKFKQAVQVNICDVQLRFCRSMTKNEFGGD
jgi:hypothetical protein